MEYKCYWCNYKLDPVYMLCDIINHNDTVCYNNYCYQRYKTNKSNLYMFYNKKLGICDFCAGTQIFKINGNSFCNGMCMDNYNKCKLDKNAKYLFINLKKYKLCKNKIDNSIRQIKNKITNITIL